MGGFTIECTLCGETFGCEEDYDSHPCTEDDVKVPFKIKLEQCEDEEENELEREEMMTETAAKDRMVTVKEEPEETMDVEEEEDPLDMGKEDEVEDENETDAEVGSLENDEEASEADEVGPMNCDPDLPVEKVTDAVSIRNECGVCGKRFYKREDFLNHTANSHKIPRPYQCKVCKKRFTQKHYVTLHMRVHTGERPYKCKLCSNTYTHKTSYTIHMRIHNGERPYMCGVCGKKCYDKSGLTSHMRSHTKETPYQCEVCGRRFTHSKSLLVHRRNHTGEKPYECQYCGKCFRHWHKHKIHIRLHTGERPYRCKVCGKGFPRNDEVKRHMRSHQGIKSFKCSICGVYCATQASITGHIDLHHADLKQVDPSAPEKTVVRDSNSGILGTKAPQPRTIYKPITTDQQIPTTSEMIVTQASTSQTTKTTKSTGTISTAKNLSPMTIKPKETGKKSKKNKEPGLTYKEFIEMQDKMLREKAKASKTSDTKNADAKDKSSENKNKLSEGKTVQVVTGNAGFSPGVQNGLAGRQIMVISPQGGQVNGAAQIVVPHSLGINKQMIVTAPANVGPRFVIQQPNIQQNNGQQMVLISQPGVQQNSVMFSQPLIFLSGTGGQRMILMPSKGVPAAPQTTPQKIVISKACSLSNQATTTTTTTTPISIKQEPIDPTELLTPKVVIKQEPDSCLPGGIVIKQEPLCEDPPLSKTNTLGVVIKQEPQDTYE